MARLGGLQLVKPTFHWGAKDKLTELEQFKANCHISVQWTPMWSERQAACAGLLVNWLGREATQILTLNDIEIDSPEGVFESLERVFRPESNQTLVHFKFRNLKQRSSQMCDSYMSELRLVLPECRYRNNANELLKDQFIFGVHNKEIQDHLLGEIKETDNSVRALYEARGNWIKTGSKTDAGNCQPRSSQCGCIVKIYKENKWL